MKFVLSMHVYLFYKGPRKNTVEDFWRMVWQVKCGKIVMLTNLSEGEKVGLILNYFKEI